MAEETTDKPRKESKPTERTVLARMEIPREVFREAVDEIIYNAVAGAATSSPVEVYIVLGEAEGSKAKAVDDVIGKAEGFFRAPASSGWKGAIEQGDETIPEQTKFRRRRVD